MHKVREYITIKVKNLLKKIRQYLDFFFIFKLILLNDIL